MRPLVTAWPTRVKRGDDVRVRARGVGTAATLTYTTEGIDARAARTVAAGDMVYATKDLGPGEHEIALSDRGRFVSKVSFWVTNAEPRPTIAVERPRVKTGEAVDVRWTEAPGERWDWVGVYAEGSVPEAEGKTLLWRHTRATVAGSARLDGTAEGEGWPLPPGAYRVFLFEDDAYTPLASTTFTVEP